MTKTTSTSYAALRARAIESLLIEKGYLTEDQLHLATAEAKRRRSFFRYNVERIDPVRARHADEAALWGIQVDVVEVLEVGRVFRFVDQADGIHPTAVFRGSAAGDSTGDDGRDGRNRNGEPVRLPAVEPA